MRVRVRRENLGPMSEGIVTPPNCVAIFLGDFEEKRDRSVLASLIGRWDSDHEESGLGSYSVSYEHRVVEEAYRRGQHPRVALAIHQCAPSLAPGPVPGVPSLFFLGTFSVNRAARSLDQVLNVRRRVMDALSTVRVVLDPPFVDGALELLRSTDGVDTTTVSALAGDTVEVARGDGGAVERLRAVRDALQARGFTARLLRTWRRPREIVRVMEALDRWSEIAPGAGHPLDAVLAWMTDRSPPPAAPPDARGVRRLLTRSAQGDGDLRSVSWLPPKSEGPARLREVAAWLRTLDHAKGTVLPGWPAGSGIDIRAHQLGRWRCWTYQPLPFQDLWILKVGR